MKKIFEGGTHVPEIVPSKIRRVYLCIITLDSIGKTIGISPFLNTFLDETLDRSRFAPLEIRPLFCSDIETLETMIGYFGTWSLPQVLEQWFIASPSLIAPFLAISIRDDNWHENEWLRTQWQTIFKSMVTILFPEKDPDVALEEAIGRGTKRR